MTRRSDDDNSFLAPPERVMWNELQDHALEVTGGDARAAVELVRTWLVDAEQAGHPWPRAIIDRCIADGIHRRLVHYGKRVSVAMVAYNGKVVAKATRVGRRRRDPETGRLYFQQTLFEDFSWAELDGWLRMIQGQIEGLRVDVHMAEKLADLKARYPDSYGPAEACEQMGTTIDRYLGDAAA